MLAEGKSINSIAKKLGTNWRMVNAWSERPEIVAQVEEIQQAAIAEVKRNGRALISKATVAFREGLRAKSGCPECGAQAPDHRTRLAAAVAIGDRFGLPKREITELAGEVGMTKSDADLETEILGTAALMLDARGETELAARVRLLLGG